MRNVTTFRKRELTEIKNPPADGNFRNAFGGKPKLGRLDSKGIRMFWDDEEGEKFLKSDGSPHFGFQFFLAREFRFPRPKPVVNPPWEMMA